MELEKNPNLKDLSRLYAYVSIVTYMVLEY